MKISLFHIVKDFLKKVHVPGKAILLGFSGGSDSLTLLYLLKECTAYIPFDLHVAHIDHGWRKESALQAQELRSLVEGLGFPFYLGKGKGQEEGKLQGKNLEAEAREERFQFFSSIYGKGDFQALILGHQAEDQAETVLKRVLEGASLFSLRSLQSVSSIRQMQIWRPLLDVPKKAISEWLEKKNVKAIEDSTNLDPKFLRARMRTQIFPDLENAFGKHIGSNLCRLASSAQELRHYFDRKIETPLSCLCSGVLGSYFDFTPFLPMEKIELRYLLKKLIEQQGITPSHLSLEAVQSLIEERKANKEIFLSNRLFYVDRSILFFPNTPFPQFSSSAPLQSQEIEEKEWKWHVTCRPLQEEEGGLDRTSSSWKQLWQGRGWAILPKEEYFLLPVQSSFSSSLAKWWGKEYTPAFLRASFPLIANSKGKIVHEFLTGKRKEEKSAEKNVKPFVFISLELKK